MFLSRTNTSHICTTASPPQQQKVQCSGKDHEQEAEGSMEETVARYDNNAEQHLPRHCLKRKSLASLACHDASPTGGAACPHVCGQRVCARYLRQQSIIKQCPSRLSNAETNVFKMQSSDRHARSAQFCIRYILISNLITLYVVYSLCRIVQHYKHYSLAGLSKFGFPMGIVTAVPISAGTVHHERFTQTCFVSCSRRITHPRVTTHTNPIVSTVSRGVSKDIRGDGPDQHPFI
eukprot:9391286-Pyramimonas_sp.AAC.1